MSKPVPQENIDDSEQALANLITELADRVSNGEEPILEDVVREYPHFETDLRELWGTVVVANAAAKENRSLSSSSTLRMGTAFELPCDFGGYRLESEVGRGGMGIVYRATRKSDGETVAIKMILKGEMATRDERYRFDAEALAASKLDHPNIVPIHEIGEHDGHAYFCMKLIEGQSLSEKLLTGPMVNEQAAQIMFKISQAIHHAHSHGVLHRDLKPSNILIDENGIPYVADFGLAKHAHNQVSLTRTGAVLGTPSYMSPEQAAGARGQVGVSSDVYSLGAILYHMLTGRPPFLGASPVDTVLMVMEQDPIAPRVLNRQVDRNLEMISMRCLQKPQDLRYPTAGDLAVDLNRFLCNESVVARFGRFGQVIGNVFRETHHATILENWGMLWMWHSLVLLITSVLTEILKWNQVTNRWIYALLWTVGLGTWAIVFWMIRRRMGPVTFVERQIAHVWAASMCAVILLFPIESIIVNDPDQVLVLSPMLAILAGMVFLCKAGVLSGTFYVPAAIMFAASIPMAMIPHWGLIIFGVTSAACFFFSGLKYYRRRQRQISV